MAAQLMYLKGSPWSVKAKWALDYHAVPYKLVSYSPGPGEYLVRWKTGKWTGPVTAPALVTPTGSLFTSFDIAYLASCHNSSLPADLRLMDVSNLGDIRRWNTLSDNVMEYGRSIFVKDALIDQEFKRGLAPSFIRKLPFGDNIAGFIGNYFMQQFEKKYSHIHAAATFEKAQAAFDEVRQQKGTQEYILGKFTYADIVMAVAVYATFPPERHHRLPLFPVKRMSLERRALYALCEDLAPWADHICDKHFGVSSYRLGKSGTAR